MSQQINLKELERRAWRSFYEDGVWDIFFGLILLALTVNAFMSAIGISSGIQMVIFIAVELVAMTWMIVGKKYITTPRLGRVTFKKSRKRRLWMLVLLGVSVFIAVVFLYGMIRENDQIINQVTVPVIWAINCIVVFGVLAYLLDFGRLYFIGLLFALTVPFNEFVLIRLSDADLGYVAFGIPTLVVLVMGGIIFIRFLNQYPVAEFDSNE